MLTTAVEHTSVVRNSVGVVGLQQSCGPDCSTVGEWNGKGGRREGRGRGGEEKGERGGEGKRREEEGSLTNFHFLNVDSSGCWQLVERYFERSIYIHG